MQSARCRRLGSLARQAFCGGRRRWSVSGARGVVCGRRDGAGERWRRGQPSKSLPRTSKRKQDRIGFSCHEPSGIDCRECDEAAEKGKGGGGKEDGDASNEEERMGSRGKKKGQGGKKKKRRYRQAIGPQNEWANGQMGLRGGGWQKFGGEAKLSQCRLGGGGGAGWPCL